MSSTDGALGRVRDLVAPIVADLGLEIYDLEHVSGVLRLTVDTPAGGPAGVALDTIALCSRLVSRELDHTDPLPGRYTLEVTSPGLERTLRTPHHFQREVGKTIAVRLLEARDGRRRLQGPLMRANDTSFVMCLDDTGTEETMRYSDVERARVVFVWGAEATSAADRSTGKKKNIDRSTSNENIGRSASNENIGRSASNENKEVV